MTRKSGVNLDAADAADDVVGGTGAVGKGNGVGRVSGVFGAEDQVRGAELKISEKASAIVDDRVDIALTATVGEGGIVVAVDENAGAGEESRIHAEAVAGAGTKKDEALPRAAVAFHGGAQGPQKGLANFENIAHLIADEPGAQEIEASVNQDDVFELIPGGREEAGATSEVAFIEQVHNRKALGGKNAIERLKAERAFVIQKIADVRLLEASLAGKLQAA